MPNTAVESAEATRATGTNNLRIYMVDNDRVWLETFQAVVAKSAGLEWAGEATHPTRATRGLEASAPIDVVLLDRLFDGDDDNSLGQGTLYVKALRKDHPSVGIFMLTEKASLTSLETFLDAEHAGRVEATDGRVWSRGFGGVAYMDKTRAIKRLGEAARLVADGYQVIQPGLRERHELWTLFQRGLEKDERRTVDEVIGRNREHIPAAASLNLSPKAVGNHLRKARTVLGIPEHDDEDKTGLLKDAYTFMVTDR